MAIFYCKSPHGTKRLEKGGAQKKRAWPHVEMENAVEMRALFFLAGSLQFASLLHLITKLHIFV